MATFLDFYEEELRKRGLSSNGSSGAPVKEPSTGLKPFVSRSQKEEEAEGIFSTKNPIGWTLDMLSRPLFGVTNVINKTAEQGATANRKFSEGDVGGGLAEIIGNLAFLPGRALEGVFSNDADDKRYGAETIEHVTDTYGALDPNYEDVQDNVNPVVKGVAGFAGDVLADPLTWIPGGVIASAGRSLARGARAGAAGAKGAVEGIRGTKAAETAEDIIEEVAPVAAKTVDEAAPAVDNVFEGATAPSPVTKQAETIYRPDATPAPASSAVEAVLSTTAKTERAAESAVEAVATGKSLAEIIKESPRTAPMKAEISDMIATLSKPASSAPVVAPKPTNAGFKTFIETRQGDELRAVQLPGDATGRRYTIAQLNTIASTDKTPRGKAAAELLRTTYVRDLGATAATAVETGIQAVAGKLQRGETVLRNVLGDDIYEQISQQATRGQEQALRKTLVKLESVLGGHLKNLDAFARQSGNRNLVANIETSFRTPFTEAKSAVKTPEEVSELVQASDVSPVTKAMRDTLKEENLPGTPEFKAKYPKYAKGNPVAKSDDGTADWWRLTNTFTQYSIYRRLQSYIDQQARSVSGLPRSAMAGPPRAAAQRRAVEELGQELTDAMETFGTGLYIGVSKDLVHLTFPEVYRELGRAMDELYGIPTTNYVLHNGGSAVPMTRLMNVVQEAVNNPSATVDELAAYIRKKTKDVAGSKELLPNNLLKKPSFAYKGEWATISKQQDLPERLAEAIIAARPALAEAAERNAVEWAERGIAEAQRLAGNHLQKVRALATNDTKLVQRELALALARKESQIAEEAAAIAATPEGTRGAVLATEAALPEESVKEAQTLLTQERRLSEGAEFEEAGTEAMLSRVKDADELTPAEISREMTQHTPDVAEPVVTPKITEEGGVEKFDIGERAVLNRERSLRAFFKESFNRNFGLDLMSDELLRIGNASSRFVTNGIIHPLRRLSQTVDSATIGQGIKAVQQGTRLSPENELAPVARELETIIGRMFDTGTGSKSAMGNIFTESGAALSHINKTLQWALGNNTTIQFSRDLAKSEAKAALPNGSKRELKALAEENLRNQWRTWDFGSDPTAALISLGQAAAKVGEHQATVASFIQTGTKNGFIVQGKNARPPAGFVKIVDTTGRSSFSALMPKNTFVAREFAEELKRLDVLTTTSRVLSGEVGNFVRSYLIPTTNLWKQGMTIYRPGHHIRNAIGNASIQYVARGVRRWGESQKAALKLMGVRNDFEGMDALRALKSMGDDAVPSGGDILVTGTIKGKPVEITQDEIWHVLNREGLLPTYTASEGLLTDEVLNTGLVGRLHSVVDAEKHALGRAAGALSQNIDHAQRIHHFMQALMQETGKRGGRWKGLDKDALYRKIADEVRRTHPDASMLTAFETKFMKLAIPFYSWLRGVLPGAIESALMHPGRVLSLPKASMNAAIAAGVNPETLTNPFPEDQLFPSFIRESVFGPQFQVGDAYLRVNPGFAHIDIAETFGLGNENPVEGALRGVLGMTNPLFRVPAELAAGGSWSTGGRIKDPSDYVDQSIPLVNYLSNLSGMSLSGSVASLPTGGGLDPQAQVAAGNKSDLDRWLTGINWLTGVNVQNLSRPNYINYAEIEKRNEAGGR